MHEVSFLLTSVQEKGENQRKMKGRNNARAEKEEGQQISEDESNDKKEGQRKDIDFVAWDSQVNLTDTPSVTLE